MLDRHNHWFFLKRKIYSDFQHQRNLRLIIMNLERLTNTYNVSDNLINKIASEAVRVFGSATSYKQIREWFREKESEILKEYFAKKE